MSLEIVTVPCLSDNYAYLVHDPEAHATAVVDVPDEMPIEAELERRGWRLTDILITHHHADHIDGVEALRATTGAKVTGARADAHRLPPLDAAVAEGDSFRIGTAEVQVIDVSGHTVGHVAFFVPSGNAVFTADSLMALGCGRLFEGTPAQMWESLCKLCDLPAGTLVYSGHEYTESNARFALTIEPANPALISRAERVRETRARGEPTVPVTLAEELATNPFLRARLPDVKAAIGLAGASDVDVFAEIRRRKDRF
jgi:hydroxyacylglutathione hydrolase